MEKPNSLSIIASTELFALPAQIVDGDEQADTAALGVETLCPARGDMPVATASPVSPASPSVGQLAQLARKPVLTPEEVALLLRLSIQTVRQMLREGSLQGRRFGRQWRIPSDQFADLIPTAAQAYPIQVQVPVPAA